MFNSIHIIKHPNKMFKSTIRFNLSNITSALKKKQFRTSI